MPRVLAVHIAHETNTFSIQPATVAKYKARLWHEGEAIPPAFAGTNSEMGAILEAAERHGWTLTHPIACFATPCGRTPAADWAVLRGFVEDALEQGPYDGVILALHGAMVCEGEDDAEGALLALVRDRLGAQIPVALTLDLHANVSDRMAALADIVVAYRTYPHIDMGEIGRIACDMLGEAMAGRRIYASTVRRPNTLMGADLGRTTDPNGCMCRMLERARQVEAMDPDIDAISIFGGFPWADIAFAGPSVTVTGRRGSDRLDAVANAFEEMIWETKDERSVEVTSLADAISMAKADGDAPLVISDLTDNPGMGSYSDHVGILRAMVEAGLENALVVTIPDPEVAAAAVTAGVGARLPVALGSKIDPAHYGPPFEAEAEVLFAGPVSYTNEGPMFAGLTMSLGPAALLAFGGVKVIVATNTLQSVDLNMVRAFGIEPESFATIVVKSAQHFRAAYGPIARDVIFVDSGALSSQDFPRFEFQRLRRPIHGLDEMED
ncbi:MAG: M81 family metallopeptidase [Pseudomonadota bacterium]